MARNAPGKHYRTGMSLIDLFDRFPDDATAEAWFVETRWPDGIHCAHCDGDNVSEYAKHPTMPYHCRSCRKFFSVKTNTVMHSSKIGYRKWVLAIYILTTNIKGTSSMKLHRDVGVSQKPHGTCRTESAKHGRQTLRRSPARSRPMKSLSAALKETSTRVRRYGPVAGLSARQ